MAHELNKDVIKNWWATYPQTYGVVHGKTNYQTESGSEKTSEFGTREFFENLDRTFYSWNRHLHTTDGFFQRVFPYSRYKGGRVLEIGCGLGTMAMNWVQHGARVTAIDLNPLSVTQTARRFKIFGLEGRILQMDARSLAFGNNQFDYVYSWGVLHHSPDLAGSVKELFRVLRPGGGFGVMLYNRGSLFFRYLILFLEGFLHAESRFLSPLQLASRYTDAADQEGNPYTWPVTSSEGQALFCSYSDDLTVKTIDQNVDFCFPPKIGTLVPAFLKEPFGRRWGWSLWITGTKR